MVFPMESCNRVVYLGLGSNSGKRTQNIKKAIKLLKKKKVKILKKSSIYKTEPIEGGRKNFKNGVKKVSKNKWFFNTAVKAKTVLSPRDLLNICREIEKELGRKKTVKWGPRTIDIDILFYGNEIIKQKDLVIPHSEMYKRRFVLIPLAEINPGFVHPVLGVKVKKLLEDLKDNFKVYKWNGNARGENG